MFVPGSIRKIKVKNFVTYSFAEFVPGPNLNMVIGPNGTGKSTIVAAIILGLGGNPKTVGRGTKISEYVKHNETDATIQIYLQGNEEDDFVKITRTFNLQNVTTWLLDNKKVPTNTIMQKIEEFNIQVNNLCQFLPQDRVQDFAKLNKQDLLKQTQISLCRDDLILKQKQLIELRLNQNEISKNIDKYVKELQDAREANAHLESKITNLKKKKKYSERIDDLNRKMAWLEFDSKQKELIDVKKDCTLAEENYKKQKEVAETLKKDINNYRNDVNKLMENVMEVKSKNKKKYKDMEDKREKIGHIVEQIRTIKNEMQLSLDKINHRTTEIENVETNLQEIKANVRDLMMDAQNLSKNQTNLIADIHKVTTQINNLKNDKENIIHYKQNYHAESSILQREIERIENVHEMRLQRLKRLDQDAYKGVLWLRQNKHLFQHKIFEPMMLEINVLDNANAKFIENVIPTRDRVAFLCSNKEDMSNLIQNLRQQQNLSVNIIYVDVNDNTDYKPAISIENLRKYGFYTYLDSLISGPKPILNYLHKTYRIQNIALGNEKTNDCYDQVPDQIRLFFSNDTRYAVNISRYSSQKIIKQDSIESDGGFSITLDMARMDHIKGKYNQLKKDIETAQIQINEIDNKLIKLDDIKQTYLHELKDIDTKNKEITLKQNKIKMIESKLEQLKSISTNPDDIRNETKQKIIPLLESSTNMRKYIVKLLRTIESTTILSLKIDNIRTKIAMKESELYRYKDSYQEAEETFNRVKKIYVNIKNQAKNILTRAKDLSNGFSPNDDGFDIYRKVYDELSDDVDVLNDEKDQMNAAINCLRTADANELDGYEKRLKRIEELESIIQKTNDKINDSDVDIIQLEREWLEPLEELIDKINTKFGDAFKKMKCAGEVSLCKSDNPQDYSQYGISIKVMYRDGEPLQELNKVVQSGGERAVATAAYVLSLQHLTPVPFRCVDEINQGMDANNERRIFEFLLDVTSQPNTSQYFLITPKLLPKLKYTPTTRVHFVHNGPFINPDRKWTMSKFCNSQNVQISL